MSKLFANSWYFTFLEYVTLHNTRFYTERSIIVWNGNTMTFIHRELSSILNIFIVNCWTPWLRSVYHILFMLYHMPRKHASWNQFYHSHYVEVSTSSGHAQANSSISHQSVTHTGNDERVFKQIALCDNIHDDMREILPSSDLFKVNFQWLLSVTALFCLRVSKSFIRLLIFAELSLHNVDITPNAHLFFCHRCTHTIYLWA